MPQTIQLSGKKIMGRNFTPFPVLKTERLTLRQLVSSDDKEIFALRSNDDVNKFLDRRPAQSMTDAENFIRIIIENIQKNDSIYWAITLNNMDKLIGTICLFNFSDDNSKAEIGFELLPAFQGQGIMQEAALKVIDFGIKHIGLNAIEACTHPENRSSIQLLNKLHFKKHRVDDNNLIRLIYAASN